jgi:hypothetical protein
MVKLLLGVLVMWTIGSLLYMPWVLARLGIYKRWYLIPFMPPVTWAKAIYLWPLSIYFICSPIVALFDVNGEEFLTISSIIGFGGVFLAGIMLLWTPRWAKPRWQLYLEDNYPYQEIKEVFVPMWREMNRDEWSQLLDSETGIKKLVRIAREQKLREGS